MSALEIKKHSVGIRILLRQRKNKFSVVQSYVPGARPARIPSHIIIISFDKRAESSLIDYS